MKTGPNRYWLRWPNCITVALILLLMTVVGCSARDGAELAPSNALPAVTENQTAPSAAQSGVPATTPASQPSAQMAAPPVQPASPAPKSAESATQPAAPVTQPANPSAYRPPVTFKPGAPASGVSSISADDARRLVMQTERVQTYQKLVEAAGLHIFLKTEETPSRFIVGVGEVQPDRNVTTLWFLVSKATGQVTEGDVTEGPPPRD